MASTVDQNRSPVLTPNTVQPQTAPPLQHETMALGFTPESNARGTSASEMRECINDRSQQETLEFDLARVDAMQVDQVAECLQSSCINEEPKFDNGVDTARETAMLKSQYDNKVGHAHETAMASQTKGQIDDAHETSMLASQAIAHAESYLSTQRALSQPQTVPPLSQVAQNELLLVIYFL